MGRYDGMRMTDFTRLVQGARRTMMTESGPYSARPTWIKFAKWVAFNGARVRGVKVREQSQNCK